jgi:hypothetical protein
VLIGPMALNEIGCEDMDCVHVPQDPKLLAGSCEHGSEPTDP